MAGDAHPEDREWTHDPLERSFFSTVGRGYLVGIVVFGLFGFLVARTQAPDWGTGAAIGAALFVAVFAGILGGVVLIGLWAMKNEELIRGNETGHAAPVDVAQGVEPTEPEPVAADPAEAAEAPGVKDVIEPEPVESGPASSEPAPEEPASEPGPASDGPAPDGAAPDETASDETASDETAGDDAAADAPDETPAATSTGRQEDQAGS